MINEKIILIGGGAQAREYFDWFGRGPGGLNIHGYLDDTGETSLSGPGYNLEYLGEILRYRPHEKEKFIFSFTNVNQKIKLVPILKDNGFLFTNLIHKTSLVAESATMGVGVVVCPYSVISSDAVIGDHVAINFHCTIGHDVNLGSYSILSSHTDITGGVTVEQAVFFGSGARVIPNLTIGSNSIIGAGSTVIRSVKSKSTIYSALSKTLK